MAEPPKQRRYVRVAVPTPASVKITAPGISRTGYLLDTSDGGMAVTIVGDPLPVGHVVTIELLAAAPDKLPPLRATVVYRIGVRHGLEFLPTQEADAK